MTGFTSALPIVVETVARLSERRRVPRSLLEQACKLWFCKWTVHGREINCAALHGGEINCLVWFNLLHPSFPPPPGSFFARSTHYH